MRKLENFREQKFEVILDEQGTALEKLEEDCGQAQQEAEQLRACLEQCSRITEAVAGTLSSGFISPLAVSDVQGELDTFWSWLESRDVPKHMSSIHGSMQTVVSYLRGNMKGFCGQKINRSSQTEEEEVGGQLTESVKKLQSLRRNIDRLMTTTSMQESIPGCLVEAELECITCIVSELIQDVHHTERQLRRMQHETLSQLYSCQEVARLQQEQKQLHDNLLEQVDHLKQMKLKTQNHPRQMQQLKQDIGEKETQLARMQQDLQCRLKSAGRYRRLLYDLLPNCDDQEEDDGEDTRWQTREMATQTSDRLAANAQTSNRNTHRNHRQTVAQDKDKLSVNPKAKLQKSNVINKGKTWHNGLLPRPEMVDVQKTTSSGNQDSDMGDTPRSTYNTDITKEKAVCISHNEKQCLSRATKKQSETCSSTHRSDSDLQYRTQVSSNNVTKQSPPSIESDQSNGTTARTAQGTSEIKEDAIGTKYKPVKLSESMKMRQEPVKAKAKVKQKFKLRNSVVKQDSGCKETLTTYEEKGLDTRRGSLTINNLEMFGGSGLQDEGVTRRRGHTQRNTLDSTRESSEFSLIGVKL